MRGVMTGIAVLAVLSGACTGVGRPQAQTAPVPAGASLWVEPSDLGSRDLFAGPWRLSGW